ncbi:MAG: hypothetical protein QNJ45_01175 [Ardenticatenaceae bacterium]|nr:hypothetical protein [Ardenticatenaceae bacterium]
MYRVVMSYRARTLVMALLLALFAFFVLGCSTILYPTFSHQGRLLDSNGDPVADGTYTVEYKLYHEATGGSAVHSETASVDIADGYFTSTFGGTDVDSKIFAQQTWLEITVNGETLEPRELLRGAPYASSLVAGSAAIGPEPITYTYGTTDNLGSAFFAVNTDVTATGGSGITAITLAQIPDSSPSNRIDVAAVRGLAADADSNSTTGTYAGIFVSEDFRGLYAKGGTNEYAAWFTGDIRVTGSCSGCMMALTAKNVGSSAIAPGDFVTALGVEVDPEFGIPILLVTQSTTGETILGVVESALERSDYVDDPFDQVGYEKIDGLIEPQEYLSVVMEGLVQARIPQNLDPEVGEFLSFDGDKVTAEGGVGNNFAQVMSEADDQGFRWILLNR